MCIQLTTILLYSTLVLTIIYIYFFIVHKVHKFNQKINGLVLGPKTLPFIGNALHFPSTQHVLPALSKFHQEFGKNIQITIGLNLPSMHITEYNLLEFVLGSSKIISKSREYRFFKRWLGSGLLTSSGEKWSKRRKLLTPAFHFQIVEQFVDVFNSASEILVQKLLTNTQDNALEFDIYPYITLCALDVICESAMGIKINAQLNEESQYVKSVKEMGRIIVDRAIHPLKIFDFFYRFSKDYQKEKRALKILHETTDCVIKKRREKLACDKIEDDYDDDDDDDEVYGMEKKNKKRLAFLDLLISSGSLLSDADIREEVDTFMFEGHDTTSSGIAFALLNIAQNVDVQNKIYDELLNIFDEDLHKNATYKDLQDMKYLEMVIKESLRLFPPVPFFIRHLDEDTEYKGSVLPKDLDLFVYAFGVQRDPEFYPNPDEFDPERFSPENKINRKPYAYIPFSAGPRNCIGQKFAMMEMKAIISKIVRTFVLRPVPGFKPQLSTELILKSANGILISLERRQ